MIDGYTSLLLIYAVVALVRLDCRRRRLKLILAERRASRIRTAVFESIRLQFSRHSASLGRAQQNIEQFQRELKRNLDLLRRHS
jgi:multidrug resistance efflux pump